MIPPDGQEGGQAALPDRRGSPAERPNELEPMDVAAARVRSGRLRVS
jgi:hypothetical protein